MDTWQDKFREEFGIHFSESELQFAIAFIEDTLTQYHQDMISEVVGKLEHKWNCHQVGCDFNRKRAFGNNVCDMNCSNVLYTIIKSK